ncbi:MAG: NifU family protein [Dongiaceae bacterium]
MSAVAAEPTRTSDLDTLTTEIARLDAILECWDDSQQATVLAYRRAVEALHKEAVRRMIAELKNEPSALMAMRRALSDEIVYAVLRHLELVRPSLQERIEQALDSVRPMLASHGGSVELVALKGPDTVEVRFIGACEHCPASALTFTEGVKKAIEQHCPEITRIEQAKGPSRAPESGRVGFVSPFASPNKGNWVFAARLDDLPEGEPVQMSVQGQDLILWRSGAVVSCFQNACAHLGMPIDAGEVVDSIITCPYHGFQYDLRSGECLTAPEVRLQPHAVRLIGSRVEIQLSS